MARPPAPAKSSTLRIKKSPDSRRKSNGFVDLALPDDHDVPTLPDKLSSILFVSFSVSFKFRNPEICAGFWKSRKSAVFVTVPETAVYKDDFAFLPEDNVRLAWQLFRVQSITISEPENEATDEKLWTRVSGMDPGHDL
jgi:hypothetical protein